MDHHALDGDVKVIVITKLYSYRMWPYIDGYIISTRYKMPNEIVDKSVEEKDLEEEIPANKIVAIDADDFVENETSFAESKNFIEILLDEEVEEGAVEYIDCSDEENCVEDNNKDVIASSDNEGEGSLYEKNLSEQTIKKEYDGEEELFNCSACNINFNSVVEHISEFHKDQSVYVDSGDGIGDRESETLYIPSDKEIKQEDNISSEDIPFEYAYLEENTKAKNIEMISEEKCFDASGRSYVRKKVHIFDVGLINSIENKCGTCQRIFYSLEELNKHDCGEYYSRSKIVNTDKWDTGKSKEPPFIFPCSECGNVFLTHRSLASHLRVHKKSRKGSGFNKSPETLVEPRCEVCNTNFPSMKSLKLHRRMHDPIKTKPIEEAVGYELKSVSRDGTPKEMFFCELCNKSYDKVFQEIHKKAHKSGPKLICSICNKKFSNKVNLTMHMNVHQDQNKPKGITKAESIGITLPYECSFCGRQFARPHEKVKHERIHTGEKPYKCEICGKCFRVSYCLTLHLRTHTGARPYVCPHCNKRFKAYSVYNHHLMTHSEDRPYKCPYCPKAFKTSVQLGGHKNSHTKPFSCPECNRPFASLYAVKAHMETHKKGSQNLKHRCGVCGAIYARIFALRDHMKEQHQSNLGDDCEGGDIILSEIGTEIGNVTSNAMQSIIPDNEEEITVGEIEHFQTEEIVTDWLK